MQGFSKGDTKIEKQTKTFEVLQQNTDILQKALSTKNVIKTLMEIQASIFDKIPKTASDCFKKIIHRKPVNNIAICRGNDEVNDQCNQPSNNMQQHNYLYADESVKPTEKNVKQPDCDTTHHSSQKKIDEKDFL